MRIRDYAWHAPKVLLDAQTQGVIGYRSQSVQLTFWQKGDQGVDPLLNLVIYMSDLGFVEVTMHVDKVSDSVQAFQLLHQEPLGLAYSFRLSKNRIP